MVQSGNINKIHSIKKKIPDYLIQLPLSEGEVFSYDDVTCFFVIEQGPLLFKCVGFKYLKSFTNLSLPNDIYGQYKLTYIYVYKEQPFNIQDLENEGWINA